jgi:hypothetical protein
MAKKISKNISALEFGCESPLRFFEACSACPRFDGPCPDLTLGKEILRGRKRLAYGNPHEKDTIHASAFNCLAPLYYFERTRKNCGHAGRCREEGLLLALLDGKKALDYSRKEVTELIPVGHRQRAAKTGRVKIRKAKASS